MSSQKALAFLSRPGGEAPRAGDENRWLKEPSDQKFSATIACRSSLRVHARREKRESTIQDLSCVRTALCLAQTLATGLGASSLLW